MASIINITGYKSFYGITTDTNDGQITALIPPVEAAIIRYIGYDPAIQDFTEYYNGTDANFLRLKAKPINSVTSVTFDPYGSSPVAYAGTNYFWNSNSVLYPKPIASIPGYFPQGNQNIKVIYNAGYSLANIPQNLKLATATMINRTIALTDPNRLKTAETLGDWSVTYGTSWLNLVDKQWEDIRFLLDQFKPIVYIF